MNTDTNVGHFGKVKETVLQNLERYLPTRSVTRSLYDTGAGGAEHSYRIEGNRRDVAAEDNRFCRAITQRNSLIQRVKESTTAEALKRCLYDYSQAETYGLRREAIRLERYVIRQLFPNEEDE